MRSFLLLFIAFNSFAGTPSVLRWTNQEDSNAEIHHVLNVIAKKSGVQLSTNELMVVEDRRLATSHFTMLIQRSQGLPVRGRVIRIWTHLKTGELLQLEAQVEALPPTDTWERSTLAELTSERTMQLVRSSIEKLGEDKMIKNTQWTDEWVDGRLVRSVTVKGKRGETRVQIAVSEQRVLDARFEEYPQSDAPALSIPIRVYPIYEEVEGGRGILPRIESELRYLNTKVTRVNTDPYAPLKTQRYMDDKFDPFLGLTLEGRKNGFWAMSFIKDQAKSLLSAVPLSDNTFANGVILQGRFATVSIDPLTQDKFKNLSFTPQHSAQFYPYWKEDGDHYEMIPTNALMGRPITSLDDAWMRPARRHPEHDPVSYINDGFDELQVYWSVTQMFDSLRPMGFSDPELSTRPFHAFLFNPDISMRDNAFYTDDTINFTTYSAKNQNYARDNTTIWHELGHGVMDRLMGDYLSFNDTGGLQEGMADFVAQLVINDVTGGMPFEGKDKLRIFNQTAFYLTNEVHDDGEAYGGAMNDLLRAAMSKYGRRGLEMVSDLTLEAMRLTRNHPNLTALDWFEHMLFADELGSQIRPRGELSPLIRQSLAGRNFAFDTSPVAQFLLRNGAEEVTSKGPGSRNNPIKHKLKAAEKAEYNLTVNLKGTQSYQFKYPVTIKVDLKTGPLQGAIHWEQEANNPLVVTLNSEADTATIPLSATGKCDEINRPDNSCVDYAYVQIWNQGETSKPQAKKRFYLRIYPQE